MVHFFFKLFRTSFVLTASAILSLPTQPHHLALTPKEELLANVCSLFLLDLPQIFLQLLVGLMLVDDEAGQGEDDDDDGGERGDPGGGDGAAAAVLALVASVGKGRD